MSCTSQIIVRLGNSESAGVVYRTFMRIYSVNAREGGGGSEGRREERREGGTEGRRDRRKESRGEGAGDCPSPCCACLLAIMPCERPNYVRARAPNEQTAPKTIQQLNERDSDDNNKQTARRPTSSATTTTTNRQREKQQLNRSDDDDDEQTASEKQQTRLAEPERHHVLREAVLDADHL